MELGAQLEAVALDIVKSAGALLLNRPDNLQFSTKSSAVDVVTEMDKASEEFIRGYQIGRAHV